MRCKDVDEQAGWGCWRGESCRAWEQGEVFDVLLVVGESGGRSGCIEGLRSAVLMIFRVGGVSLA